MNNNNNNINKEIDEYVGKWRDNHPSIMTLKEKEEQYKMLKSEYDMVYKKYIENVKKDSNKNYTLNEGHNVPGVQDLINKNKVRYVRVEHNYQYIHINELEIFDEFNNNVAENSEKKKVFVSITVGNGRWDDTGEFQWISLLDGNREVTKRYSLKNKYFRRGATINFILPVNLSSASLNGLFFYVGNNGTRIDRVRLWIYDDNIKKWNNILDNKKRGQWFKNSYGKLYFPKISFNRDPNKPDAYASSEGWRGDANKVIDGEHEAEAWWPTANSNHTYARSNEYVEVDLKKSYNIKRIRVWNRPDCCRWRLWNSKLILLNEARQPVGKTIKLAANRVKDYYPEIDNQPNEGRIAKSFKRWIGLEECNKLCAEDDNCQTALYRRQLNIPGKGWTYGNQCIHYDGSVKETESIPIMEYQYTAFNKPVWEDHKNKEWGGRSEMVSKDDNDTYKYLGIHDTLSSCKNEAVESDKGPFNHIVYYSKDFKEDSAWKKQCYGKAQSFTAKNSNKINTKGVYTSVPPGGETGVIDLEHQNSLDDVIFLNKKLKKLGDEIIDLHMKLYKAGEKYDGKIKALNFNVDNKKLKELQDLEKQRKALLKIEKDIGNLKSNQDNFDYTLTTNQYTYAGLTIVALALVGITASQINKL